MDWTICGNHGTIRMIIILHVVAVLALPHWRFLFVLLHGVRVEVRSPALTPVG